MAKPMSSPADVGTISTVGANGDDRSHSDDEQANREKDARHRQGCGRDFLVEGTIDGCIRHRNVHGLVLVQIDALRAGTLRGPGDFKDGHVAVRAHGISATVAIVEGSGELFDDINIAIVILIAHGVDDVIPFGVDVLIDLVSDLQRQRG